MASDTDLSSCLYGFYVRDYSGQFGYIRWSNKIDTSLPRWVIKAVGNIWGSVWYVKPPTQEEEKIFSEYIESSRQLYDPEF